MSSSLGAHLSITVVDLFPEMFTPVYLLSSMLFFDRALCSTTEGALCFLCLDPSDLCNYLLTEHGTSGAENSVRKVMTVSALASWFSCSQTLTLEIQSPSGEEVGAMCRGHMKVYQLKSQMDPWLKALMDHWTYEETTFGWC